MTTFDKLLSLFINKSFMKNCAFSTEEHTHFIYTIVISFESIRLVYATTDSLDEDF